MSEKSKLLYCSFCGKSQHEVCKLIAGPQVFICEACVDLCIGIIKEEAGSQIDELSMPNLKWVIREAHEKEKGKEIEKDA